MDQTHRPHYSVIDNIEREYRARAQPQYQESVRVTGSTVDPPAARASFNEQVNVTGVTIDGRTTRPAYTEQVKFTVFGPVVNLASPNRDNRARKAAIPEGRSEACGSERDWGAIRRSRGSARLDFAWRRDEARRRSSSRAISHRASHLCVDPTSSSGGNIPGPGRRACC